MAKINNNTNESEFVNPFTVSYPEFIKALGDKTVKEYLSGKSKNDTETFTDTDIEWLTNEIEAYKYNELHKKENLERAAKESAALYKENEKQIN